VNARESPLRALACASCFPVFVCTYLLSAFLLLRTCLYSFAFDVMTLDHANLSTVGRESRCRTHDDMFEFSIIFPALMF
jgi:hypothetical protein